MRTTLIPMISLFLTSPFAMAQRSVQTDQPLTFPALLPKVRLECRNGSISLPGSFSSGLPAKKRIRLKGQGKDTVIQNLNDLKGWVQISNEETAQQFVRLRTSLATFRLWPGSLMEVEVWDRSQLANMPTYGLKSISGKGLYSGAFGLLSHAAYQSGRFNAPTITREQSGFRIIRWIFVTDYAKRPHKMSVQQIQEEVSNDGAYRRKILQNLLPPHLPETTWNVEGED